MKKKRRACKSSNLSFLRSHGPEVVHPRLSLLVHVVAGIQEWLESLLAGPGARRRGKGYRLTFGDHTVELSAFWHVIRPRRSRASHPALYLHPATVLRGTVVPATRISSGIRVSDDCGNEIADWPPPGINVYQRVGRHPDSFRAPRPFVPKTFERCPPAPS